MKKEFIVFLLLACFGICSFGTGLIRSDEELSEMMDEELVRYVQRLVDKGLRDRDRTLLEEAEKGIEILETRGADRVADSLKVLVDKYTITDRIVTDFEVLFDSIAVLNVTVRDMSDEVTKLLAELTDTKADLRKAKRKASNLEKKLQRYVEENQKLSRTLADILEKHISTTSQVELVGRKLNLKDQISLSFKEALEARMKILDQIVEKNKGITKKTKTRLIEDLNSLYDSYERVKGRLSGTKYLNKKTDKNITNLFTRYADKLKTMPELSWFDVLILLLQRNIWVQIGAGVVVLLIVILIILKVRRRRKAPPVEPVEPSPEATGTEPPAEENK